MCKQAVASVGRLVACASSLYRGIRHQGRERGNDGGNGKGNEDENGSKDGDVSET